ncbi:MAG: ABC transporter permease, partial [Hyphomicrobiales bacterium]|nr:ABC transporter permease [Hyphomicrobiales bacterium]
MIAFIIRRLFASIGVLVAVGLIAFLLFRYVGDPVNQMVGIETPESERVALRQQLGLNDPTIIQAFRFLGNAARLDFGISYQFKQPVSELIGARMPATLELAFVASIMSLVAGIPMGVYTALRRKS